MRRLPISLLLLGGCGLLPRSATGDELMDAVLTRVDPFGGCVAVDTHTLIFKDIGGPNDPPGQLTQDSFEHPDVRAAAAAIAISYPDYVRQIQKRPRGNAQREDGCTMDVSRPAVSGTFAFVGYSSPDGAVGVYAFRKRQTGWGVVEHKQLGYW
jgi:hypothetical protein